MTITRRSLNRHDNGEVSLLECILLVAIGVILLAVIIPFATGYNPRKEFQQKCQKAGGTPVMNGREWTCYAPGVVIPIE